MNDVASTAFAPLIEETEVLLELVQELELSLADYRSGASAEARTGDDG